MEGEPPAQGPPSNAGSGPAGGGEKGAPCQECGEQPWKYRCPGCSRLTCSLPCVQAHKRRTACSGKRPRTDPVPISQFDDNQLLSDYNLLEETSQARESAHRLILGFGRNYGGDRAGAKLPAFLTILSKAALRRGIQLVILPRGMTRREQNRSHHIIRNNCIYWTLEWKFSSTDIVLTDHQIDEHASLLSLLEKHLSPTPLKDHLTPFRNTELRDLKLFIQKSAKDSKSPYRQINIEEPLRPQLRGILIVEYPTINVFLPSDACEFEVEFVNKIRNEQAPGSLNDSPPIQGTEFHEEEIEEGEMVPETQVIDLKDCRPSRTTNLSPVKVTSEPKIDSNKRDSSVLSYIRSLGLDGQRRKLNQHSKIAPKTPSWTTETKSCMKVYPLDSEESVEGGSLERQVIDLNDHATSHPANIGPSKVLNCKTDSPVLCPIGILASDGLSGPQEEYNQQSKLTPNTTPQALKRRSHVKVYPLDMDTEDTMGLGSEVPNQEFELDVQDAYEELFGDMNPDDFLNFDLDIMDGDGSFEIRSPFKLWDDLEEGEIPSLL